MIFRVGQKVVCVDAEDNSDIPGLWIEAPIKGNIYTITRVGLTHPFDPQQLPCVLVAELDRDEYSPLWAHRFRPLIERKTDISFAHEILRKATKQAPADSPLVFVEPT